MSRHRLTIEAESGPALLRTLYALVAAAERRCGNEDTKPDGAPSRVDWHEDPDPDAGPFDEAETVDLRDGNWHPHDRSMRKPEQLSMYDQVMVIPEQQHVKFSRPMFACEIEWSLVDSFRVV